MNKDEGSPAEDPNLDLYCLECGYNLRGLAGDPRRCPECGHENPMSDLTVPAAAITRTLRQMETAPTLCVAATAGLLLASPALVSGAWYFRVELCPLVFFLFAAVAWTLAAARFRSTCGCRSAWKWALLKYHVYGLGAGLVGGSMIIKTGFLLSRRSVVEPCGTILAIDAAIFMALLLFGRWARRNIKSVTDPIQREMAVRIAREEMARRMRRAR